MNEDSRKRSPLRERFREQARAEILAAARRVFTQEGIEESRIDVVAAEAGVSVGTIYNLYGDRAGLVAAVLTSGRDEFVARVGVYMEETAAQTFVPRLGGLVQMLVLHMRRHWPMLRLVAQREGAAGCAGGPAQPPTTVVRTMHGHLSGMIRQGIAEGVLADVDVHVATCAVMGAIRNTIDVDMALGLEAPTEARADAILKLFLEGAARRT
jgi:AcrR family transcriptional regulator